MILLMKLTYDKCSSVGELLSGWWKADRPNRFRLGRHTVELENSNIVLK